MAFTREDFMELLAIFSFFDITSWTLLNFLSNLLDEFESEIIVPFTEITNGIIAYLDSLFFNGFTLLAVLYLIYYHSTKISRKKQYQQYEYNPQYKRY